MKILRWINNNLEKYVMVAALVAISFLLMFQVVMRYIFHNALGWPEELARYFFILFAYFTLGFCVKYDLNFNIDLLMKAVPEVPRKILKLFSNIGFLFFYSFCFYYSIEAVQQAAATHNVTTGLQMPVFILYVICGLGFFVGAIRAVQVVIRNITDFRKPVAEEGDDA